MSLRPLRVPVVLLAFVLAHALAGCARGNNVEKPPLPPLDEVPAGAHELKSLQYNDTNDVWRVFLAQPPSPAGATPAPPGTNPLRLRGLRLAQLSDADMAAGKRPYITRDDVGPVAYLGPRFKIVVLHGVVEERVDTANDGRRKNVVVRSERRVWQPFAAPKIVDGKNLWEHVAAHYPPPWTGGPLVGSGATGPTREAAYEAYRRAHGVLPQAVRLELDGYTTKVATDEREEAAPDDAGTRVADAGVPADARDNRIIGAVEGTRAEKLRIQKRAEEQARKRAEAAEKAKQTP